MEESSDGKLRPVLDFYDSPGLEWSLRSAGTHLHPGRETATVHLAERAQQFGFPTGATVLDIASALGGPARFVARHFSATVICLDMNPIMQRALWDSTQKEGLSLRCRPVLARSERMPFAESSFDAAWSQDALCHMDKPAVVAEVARVLKPDSIFAFTDWVARRELDTEESGVLARLWGFPSLLRISEYVALLSARGFELLLAEDRTAAVTALPTVPAPDQELFEHAYGERWGHDEVGRQKAPGEAWREMVEAGAVGFGMFIARRREGPA